MLNNSGLYANMVLLFQQVTKSINRLLRCELSLAAKVKGGQKNAYTGGGAKEVSGY